MGYLFAHHLLYETKGILKKVNHIISFEFGIFLLSFLMLVGCARNTIDQEVPTTAVQSPENGQSFFTGSKIPVSLSLADDVNLDRYNIRVRKNDPFTTSWDTLVILRLEGQTADVDMALDVPLWAKSGNYELKFYCEDQFDKISDSTFVYVNLIKGDTILPSVLSTAPEPYDAFYTDGQMPVKAELSDNETIVSYALEVKSLTNDEGWDLNFSQAIWGNPVFIDTVINIPEAALSGAYELLIHGTDISNNTTTIAVPFSLQNSTDPSPPQVNITSPYVEDTVTVFSGSNLIILGNAQDENGLLALKINLYDTDEDETLLYQQPVVSLQGNNAYTLQEIVPVPAESGYYIVEMIITDTVNNANIISFVLKVL